MKPKISIIIPTYNRCDYLGQTIKSALAQDYENYEVVISDNCSSDNTPSVVAKYLKNKRVKYFKNHTNLGMVKNWHTALYKYSTGDWFLILSDDDYLIDSQYLTKAVALMNKDNEIKIVYANGYIKYEDTGEIAPLELPFNEINDGTKIFLSRWQITPQDFTLCNVLFEKNEALKHKPFDNEFNLSCDSEVFLMMCIYCKVGVIKDYVSVYRVHKTNLIKYVGQSWELFLNNHYAVLTPFIEAKSANTFTEKNLDFFKRRVILRQLDGSLRYIKHNYPDKTDEFQRYIKNIDTNLWFELSKYKKLSIKAMLVKHYPSLYSSFYDLKKHIVTWFIKFK